MADSIESYKLFIDDVVSVKHSVTSDWVKRGSFPKTTENEQRNVILSSLSGEQLEEVSKLMQESKESGIHDLLVLINESCTVTYKDAVLPREPFGTEMHFDFVARACGENWPNN